MYDINKSVYSIYIDKNNASQLPSDIKYFLNPTSTRKLINLSADEVYTFFNNSYDSATILPAWYMNGLTFNRLILNFTFQLNISGFFNTTYDNINWIPTQVISQINFDYLVHIDLITGIVLNMREKGNIKYYESNSFNIEPYFGLPYNISMYITKSNSILNSNAINFGISYWIWIVLIIIVVGVIFVIVYVKMTGGAKEDKKSPEYEGNILNK